MGIRDKRPAEEVEAPDPQAEKRARLREAPGSYCARRRPPCQFEHRPVESGSVGLPHYVQAGGRTPSTLSKTKNTRRRNPS
eukprot:5451206-Amphidinium_carterae.1